MASFSQTINKLIFKNVGQHNIKVSVIKFHSTASVIYENCCPHKITKNLGYSGGGTNFDPPFIEAASIAARYINDAVIVFIFMTDGEAPYPTKGMEAFKKLKAKYGNRLKYSGI